MQHLPGYFTNVMQRLPDVERDEVAGNIVVDAGL